MGAKVVWRGEGRVGRKWTWGGFCSLGLWVPGFPFMGRTRSLSAGGPALRVRRACAFYDESKGRFDSTGAQFSASCRHPQVRGNVFTALLLQMLI